MSETDIGWRRRLEVSLGDATTTASSMSMTRELSGIISEMLLAKERLAHPVASKVY